MLKKKFGMNKFNAILYGLGKIGASYASDRKTKIYFDYISHAQVLKIIQTLNVWQQLIQKQTL